MCDQQNQRQRVMMVFGKQSIAEVIEKTSSISSRSFHLSINERKPDDAVSIPDNSSTIVSKLFPMHPDNMSINLAARYDLSSLNRSQTMVRKIIKKYKLLFFLCSFI